MHCKVLKPKGSIVLRYSSTTKNPFDEQANRMFAQGFPQIMLEYTVIVASTNSCEVHYDVTRLITLAEYLNKPLNEASLRELLVQVKSMLDTCLSLHLPLKNVVLDVNQVYYDSWTRTLRFIYLPFQSLPPDAKKMQAFFEKFATKVRPADEGAAQMSAAYRLYVRENTPLEPVAFSTWLGNLLSGKTYQGTAAHSVCDDGGYKAEPTKDDPIVGRTIWDRPRSAHNKTQDHSKSSRNSNLSSVGGETTMLDECGEVVKRISSGGTPSHEIRGKHASMPPATGVLNALNWDALSRGERLQLLGEDESRQSVLKAPTSGVLQETTVLDDVEVQLTPASGCTPAPDGEPEPSPASEQASETQSGGAKNRFWLIRSRTGERVELTGDRFVVGKSMYSSYQVRNTTTVSRSHAVFCCANDCCRIEDADSSNGTFVNGERLKAHVDRDLVDGDAIRMSDEDFVFEVERTDT